MAEKKEKGKGAASKASDAASKKARDEAKRAKGAGRKGPGKRPEAKAKAPAPARPAAAAKPTEPEAAPLVHKARIQATVGDDVARAMHIRAAKKSVEPEFRRHEWWRYKKLSRTGWRRPMGLHSKQRQHLKYRKSEPSAGFRGPVAARGLHPSGFEEVLVFNAGQLAGLDPARQAARIGGSVGSKKREVIEAEAAKRKIRVLNGGGTQ